MPNRPEPNWQPISQLPLLASIIDGMLANSKEQYESFLEAREKPHVLNDTIVDRAARLYQAQLDDLWVYQEQFARWQKEPLTDRQRQEVNRLVDQLPRIKQLSQTILDLLKEIRAGTIDRILEKSDLELGLEVLLKGWIDSPSPDDD